MKQYDYLLVGSGLFAATFAHEATEMGKTCLVLERRKHIGGNAYCENCEGIQVHRYGAHIFHTNDLEIWNYVNQFAAFNHYINSPIANFNGEIYNLPFNMNTFSKMWGISKPDEAKAMIAKQSSAITGSPKNLEEQAIHLVGRDIYERLIKGYTEKQWGRRCSDLPAFIIRRLPVRYTYNNNYFEDRYQGIPIGGYTAMIEKMFGGCEIELGVDYNENREKYTDIAQMTIYTGAIDAYFNYCYGNLQYRSLRFETERLEQGNMQGVAVINYTDADTPYTRIIEHKHFEFGAQPYTYVTKEYPLEWHTGAEPYYPINDEINQNIFEKYRSLALCEERVIFGGRLAEYRYYDMDKTIMSALRVVRRILRGK